jgi:hypothetical protein
VVTTSSYNAAAIFQVIPGQRILGNPEWADLRIESSRILAADKIRGAGLYAIHFNGQLIYIGQFRGTRTNAFGGDVCATRWAKHLGAFTSRDRRISFSPAAINNMRAHQHLKSPLADIINAAGEAVIHKDRGRVSSLNRALFAAEHWDVFSRIDNAQGLAGFTVTYTQIEMQQRPDHGQIRAAVEAVEKRVIACLRPRCNAEILSGNAGNISIQETGSLFEGALKTALEETHDATGAREWTLTLPLSWRQAAPLEEQSDDDARVTAEEAFLERLGDFQDARDAVDRITQAFDRVEDAHIQHTHSNGGDLRISSVVGRRRFSNVARIYWQPKCVRFRAEINLSTAHCLKLGATTANPNYAGSVLPTQATFEVPDRTGALVNCLLAAAEKQRTDFAQNSGHARNTGQA